jgi:hypothetical protein
MEVNLRARYKQEATLDLIDAAIQKAASERGTFEFSDRVGLVAWCLGRFSVFDKPEGPLRRMRQARAFFGRPSTRNHN